jgi:hypothetical protein
LNGAHICVALPQLTLLHSPPCGWRLCEGERERERERCSCLSIEAADGVATHANGRAQTQIATSIYQQYKSTTTTINNNNQQQQQQSTINNNNQQQLTDRHSQVRGDN